MNDLIDRQAAIDAIKEWGLIDGLSEGEAIEILEDEEKVPSAFPCPEGFDPAHPTEQDKKDILEALEWVRKKIDCTTADVPDTNDGDMSSRQAAFDEILHIFKQFRHDPIDHKRDIEALPSAQPETEERTAEPAQKVPNGDLVSRKAAIDALNEYFARIGKLKRRGLTEGEKAIRLGTLGAIKILPSAQPEIIRCKDCKYSEHWYRDKRRCFLWHETGIDVFEDGFCNYAERRDDAVNDMMTFPDTWEEFEKSYGFTDSEEVYTNGARLIPSFRVKQWLDHLPPAQPEVIRCKDCKWFITEYGWNCIEFAVCGMSPTYHPIRKEEDFCSKAERRRNDIREPID